MRPAVARLAICTVLFVGWLGYLFYLVQLGKPLVLSRPQFLISQYDVIATIEGAERVKVQDILYPHGEAAGPLKAQGEIKVVNLEGCKIAAPEGEKEAVFREEEHKGNAYLLPLRSTTDGSYEVVPAPAVTRLGPPRIYPATEQARAEYRQLRKPE